MKNSVYLLLSLLCCFKARAQAAIFSETAYLMGSRFEITLVCEASKAPELLATAVAEITRIEHLISSWEVNSETSAVNRNAGVAAVKVAPLLFELVQRCLAISKITDGAFDISYASLDPIWKFDGSMTAYPSKAALEASVAKIGYEKIIIDTHAQTIFLKEKGMKIGFGAIGKGFAADLTKDLMKSLGVQAGIINASGDLSSWGEKPDHTPWQVGISNPNNPSKVFSWFPVINAAVATSGNYEKYLTLDNIKYSHILDPRTGVPVSGLKSVTVFAPKAELADALATATFVMGLEIGMNVLSQLPGVSCIIVDDTNKIHYSKNIRVDAQ